MPRRQKRTEEAPKKLRPALSPQARENQLISLAIDLAEKQLMEGTASAQVITHYLKLATTRERIERDILEEQKQLLRAKTEAINSSKRVEELYENALNAMRLYSGNGGADDTEL